MQRPTMRRFVQCEENNSPVLHDGETMLYELANVGLYFKASDNYNLGTIFITSSRVVWISDQNAFDFDVPYITLHAVSRDPSSFPQPCLYCQLDHEEEEVDDDDENSDNQESVEPHEVYFVPKEETSLLEMFDAFSRTALLNPDPEEDGDELGEYGDELIYNTDEVELGAEQARRLEQLESVFQFPMGLSSSEGGVQHNDNNDEERFADADADDDVYLNESGDAMELDETEEDASAPQEKDNQNSAS